jgi:hypothetical protein
VFEYGGYPGDVSHGGSEAPLTHDGEFGVQFTMHRSYSLVDPPSRAARALFLALHASRSVSFSSPALAVALSSDILSSVSLGERQSSSPSSAINT